MNKNLVRITVMIFVLLIVFSSLIRIYGAINVDNIIKEDPETIRIHQIEENLDVIQKILLMIQIIVSIVHVIKSKKYITVSICSFYMVGFSCMFKTVRDMAGGLPGTERTPEENLILTIAGVVITILMIGIHIFFIRKNSKTDKDICQNNKNEGRIDIN